MNLKMRLTTLSFLQFFVWGIWLISLGGYMFASFNNPVDLNLGFKVGNTYGTMGWASLFMPALLGILADKYIRAEVVLGISHILGGFALYYASTVTSADEMYWAIFAVSCFYMPTIALSNSVSYSLLSKNNFDIQKSFAPIRVWGTVGFIVAEWAVDLHLSQRREAHARHALVHGPASADRTDQIHGDPPRMVGPAGPQVAPP